jgi:ribonuclease HI
MKRSAHLQHAAQQALTARASARFDAELAQAALRDGVWQATFDGSAVGGLGRMGAGGVLYAPSGAVHEISQPLPGHGCNNEAEYRALMAVLQALQAQGAERVHIWGDSDLVIRQLRGEQRDKAERLAAWRKEAMARAHTFASLGATWVPRHRNARADALAASARQGGNGSGLDFKCT